MNDDVVLPNFRYFMVTWGVGGEFGGMTSMCLTRARSMAKFAGTHAPILTFEMQPDYGEIIDALLKSKQLVDGMEICNIYHHYRSINLDDRVAISEEDASQFDVPNQDIQSQTIRDGNGRVFCRVTRNLDGTKEYYREYRRLDGSVFLTEAREYGGDGNGRHELRLFDVSGRTVGLYKSREAFYRAWMLELTENEPSVFVADSVKTTKFTGTLRAKHVMKMAVMHNSHIAGGGEPLHGKLAVGRRDVTVHSQRWDGILFLTERHKRDFMDRFGEANNLFTLSNPSSRAIEFPAFSDRVANRGVMVCRLEHAKNIFAAIDVIDLARRRIPSVRLDIYGTGRQSLELQEYIDELQLHENVTIHGYLPNAGEQFRTAVFSLLTSRKEGQPLVLLESQGLGCPPISFNIRYGPDDVISDGENGFLVSEGDIHTAAERVIQLCSNDNLAHSISKRAWQSSKRYGHAEVLKRFGTIVDQALRQRGERIGLAKISFVTHSFSTSNINNALLSGTLSWKQTSGRPAEGILTVWLQVMPPNYRKPLWIRGSIQYKAHGRIDVQFDLSQHGLARDSLRSHPFDAFVIASGRNMLFRQRVDSRPT